MVNGRPEDPRALSPPKSEGCGTPAWLPLRTNLSACQGPCPSIAPFYPSLPFVLALTVCQALGFRCCHIQSEQAHEVSTAAFCSSTFEKTEYPSKKRVCPRLTIREELGSEPSPLPCTLSQGDGPFPPRCIQVPGAGGRRAGGSGARGQTEVQREALCWLLNGLLPSQKGLNSEMTQDLFLPQEPEVVPLVFPEQEDVHQGEMGIEKMAACGWRSES